VTTEERSGSVHQFIDGRRVRARTSASRFSVVDPATGENVESVELAGPDDVDDAVAAARRAYPKWAGATPAERSAALVRLAALLGERADELATTETRQTGKPIKLSSEFDVPGTVDNVAFFAGAARNLEGKAAAEYSPDHTSMVRRESIGVVGSVSPWNYPLQMAAWKILPAIAAGNTIVLKPPSRDPLTMLLFAEIVESAGVPKGAVSIMPMDRAVGDALVEDPRFKLLSFTGSPDVGWAMKNRAGMKKVVLELGGNAGVIIDSDSDLDFAVNRIRVGAFAYSGQVCISVQRVFVVEDVYEQFRDKFVAAVGKIQLGDPGDRTTDLGPMIDEKAVQRTQDWIDKATAEGARVLTGGSADGTFFPPTVIENADPASFVCSREAFAPLVTIAPVKSFGEAIGKLNDSEFGLQAGVFTNSLEKALVAYENIDVGGVVINDIPSYRIDHMPYGGVKASGLGREGLKYAIEDMTEPRLMVLNRLESEAVTLD
jgi:betaine-aldehyde dehydrogenase